MRQKGGYRYLLGGILSSYLLAISVPSQAVGAPIRVGTLGAILWLATRSRPGSAMIARLALTLAVVTTVGTFVVSLITTGTPLLIVSHSVTVVLVIAAIIVLASTLLQAPVVDQTTINGVLCIYLLLALLFGSINELFAIIEPHYVRGTSSPPTSSDMLYYSVITLTTVGFGDITPASSLARGVAATEALLGQLYLVSVVAAVVSRYHVPDRER